MGFNMQEALLPFHQQITLPNPQCLSLPHTLRYARQSRRKPQDSAVPVVCLRGLHAQEPRLPHGLLYVHLVVLRAT